MTEKQKITRDEIIEALMEEWWEGIECNCQDSMIDEWLEDTGFELE